MTGLICVPRPMYLYWAEIDLNTCIHRALQNPGTGRGAHVAAADDASVAAASIAFAVAGTEGTARLNV